MKEDTLRMQEIEVIHHRVHTGLDPHQTQPGAKSQLQAAENALQRQAHSAGAFPCRISLSVLIERLPAYLRRRDRHS